MTPLPKRRVRPFVAVLALGMSVTHVRDRAGVTLLLIRAMAMTLLTQLAAAGESLGMDRMLAASTTAPPGSTCICCKRDNGAASDTNTSGTLAAA